MPEARSCIKLRGLFSVDGKSKIRKAICLVPNEGTHCRWHQSRVHVWGESCTVGPESPKAEEEPDLLFYKITLTKINWGPWELPHPLPRVVFQWLKPFYPAWPLNRLVASPHCCTKNQVSDIQSLGNMLKPIQTLGIILLPRAEQPDSTSLNCSLTEVFWRQREIIQACDQFSRAKGSLGEKMLT